MDFSALTTFFGWTAVLNIVFLLFASGMLISMRSFIVPIHENMLGLSEEALNLLYARFLAQYKCAAFVFSVIPYLALKLMGY